MTGLPSRQLDLKDRGRIAQGFVADLVLFDPAVMVAGTWVIDNGQPTGAHPGKLLRSTAFRR